jgi:hypothetical protein
MRICTHHEVYVADIDEARPSRLDDTDVVSVEDEPAGFDVWFIGDHESSLVAGFRGVDFKVESHNTPCVKVREAFSLRSDVRNRACATEFLEDWHIYS